MEITSSLLALNHLDINAKLLSTDHLLITEITNSLDLWSQGLSIEIVQVIERPLYRVTLTTQNENRKFGTEIKAYHGELIGLNRNPPADLWDLKGVAPPPSFTDLIHRTKIDDSDEIIDCDECFGKKELTCHLCAGRGDSTCSYCGGSANLKCKLCEGRGELRCNSCGGNGLHNCYICFGKGVQSDFRGVTTRCLECAGRGVNPCSECRQGWHNCRACGGQGLLPCSFCGNRGVLNCLNCACRGITSCTHCNASGRVIRSQYLEQSYTVVQCHSPISNEEIPKSIALLPEEAHQWEKCFSYTSNLIEREFLSKISNDLIKSAFCRVLKDYQNDARIVKQEISISKARCIFVSCRFEGKTYTLWISGITNLKIHAAVSPMSDLLEEYWSNAKQLFMENQYDAALDQVTKAKRLGPPVFRLRSLGGLDLSLD